MKQCHDYDLIVIGGGIAGMVSAVTANGLGKHVAVIGHKTMRNLLGNAALQNGHAWL